MNPKTQKITWTRGVTFLITHMVNRLKLKKNLLLFKLKMINQMMMKRKNISDG